MREAEDRCLHSSPAASASASQAKICLCDVEIIGTCQDAVLGRCPRMQQDFLKQKSSESRLHHVFLPDSIHASKH